MSDQTLRFLIVGTARSGTTLIQRLSCELPDVWVPPETHFWSLADEAVRRFEFPLRSHNRQDMVDWMLDELRDRTLPVDRSVILDEIGAHEARVGLWVVFESLVAAMSPDRPILGEKTPGHLAQWEVLTNAIPDLKMIGVVRDPYAVLRSHRSVPWGEHDPWALAERWVAHQRSIEDMTRLLGPQRALVFRYEDVVADPHSHQRAMASFLGTVGAAEELDAELLERFPLFPERETWKADALGAIAARRSRWGEELTEEDLAIVDAVAGPTMAIHGYERRSQRPPPPMSEVSRSAVAAFRQWYAQNSASTGLPIR